MINIDMEPMDTGYVYPPALTIRRVACSALACAAIYVLSVSVPGALPSVIGPSINSTPVSVTSTFSSNCSVYNSGNFSFSYQGAAMDEDLSKSLVVLDQISNLNDNWNGFGANKFSSNLLNSARELVQTLSKQPRIFPTARDSIQFEYDNSRGDYLEFELFEDGQLKEFFCDNAGKTNSRIIDIKDINPIVNQFYDTTI